MNAPYLSLPFDTKFPYVTSDRSALGFDGGKPVIVNQGGPPVPVPVSDVLETTGATVITNIVAITQTDYNNLVAPDETTLYLIKEELV